MKEYSSVSFLCLALAIQWGILSFCRFWTLHIDSVIIYVTFSSYLWLRRITILRSICIIECISVVCVYVAGCICHSTCAEDKGQLTGVGFFLPCGFCETNLCHQAWQHKPSHCQLSFFIFYFCWISTVWLI